ncbi:MAG: adhesin AidA-related protein [Bacteroidetes bacterium OLB9]|nr:MAG: adhesin AidA-related protein [Bacteroidetes bacterium OLB9]
MQYLWSNGEKTQNIKDLVAGTYNCTVTDENGCQKQFGPFIVENTTSVNEAAYIDHLNIYPNPVSTDVFIDAKLVNKGNVSIELTNSIGEILMTQHFTDKVHTSWDVSSLSGGVYLISIKGKDFTVSRRLMVIR